MTLVGLDILSPKSITFSKRKDHNPVHVAMMSHVEEEEEKEAGNPFYRGEKEDGGGAVTTLKLCYKHRILLAGVSQ